MDEVFSMIILIGDFNEHVELLLAHSRYLNILIKPIISQKEVQSLSEPLFHIRRKGKDFYHLRSNWITINSHLVLHFPLNITRFGSSRNTWVYSFENQMGVLKRWIMEHRNGKSEGLTMLNYIWRMIFAKTIKNSMQ